MRIFQIFTWVQEKNRQVDMLNTSH